MNENFSNNSLISEAKEPWDPYHFEIGNKEEIHNKMNNENKKVRMFKVRTFCTPK